MQFSTSKSQQGSPWAKIKVSANVSLSGGSRENLCSANSCCWKNSFPRRWSTKVTIFMLDIKGCLLSGFRSCLHFLIHGPLALFSQPAVVGQTPLTLQISPPGSSHRTYQPLPPTSTIKDPYSYTGSTQLYQNNLFILRSVNLIPSQSSLGTYDNIYTGIRGCIPLGTIILQTTPTFTRHRPQRTSKGTLFSAYWKDTRKQSFRQG